MDKQETKKTNKIISIRDLDKTYQSMGGDPLCALEGLELDVKEGEFVTIVGPSGCGKSTLLKIISGILPYSNGSVEIRGNRVEGPIGGIGMVFQTPALLPWRKIIGNVLLPIEMLRQDVEDYVNPARQLIELAGLRGFEDKYPFELSGGMQQRVSICRALIHDPPILLMDEPFGALDALTRDEMGYELLRIWNEKKKTVVFVTHSIAEAVFLADRVAIMSTRPGRIISVEKINLSRPRSLETKASPEFSEYINIIRKKITRVLPHKTI